MKKKTRKGASAKTRNPKRPTKSEEKFMQPADAIVVLPKKGGR